MGTHRFLSRSAMGVLSIVLLASCAAINPGLQDVSAERRNTDNETPIRTGLNAFGSEKAAFNTDGAQNVLFCDSAVEYVPHPPLPSFTYTDYSIVDGKFSADHQNFSQFDGDDRNEEINKRLPNIASTISLRKIEGSANVAFFGTKVERFVVIIDFMKFRNDPVFAADNTGIISRQPLYYARIGAGLRVEIDITTADSDLNLTNLLSIAASAKAGKTTGFISADIIGVTSSDITLLAPFTSDLSDDSIKRIIEAMASIRAKLHESDAELSPHYLARLDC